MSQYPAKHGIPPVHPVRGILSPDHPAAIPYRGFGGPKRARFIRIAVVVATLIFFFVSLPVSVNGPPVIATASLLLPFVLVAVCRGLEKWVSRVQAKHVYDADRRAIGGIPQQAQYVGIAYADGFWNLDSSYSWDRGWLSISPDGLIFQGRASDFALPAHAVHSTHLGTHSMEASSQRRLFIDWVAPDGEVNTLSLEALIFDPPRSRGDETRQLLDEIESTLSQRGERPISPIWPPSVNQDRLQVGMIRFDKGDWRWILVGSVATTLAVCVGIYGALSAYLVDLEEILRLIQGFVMLIFTGSLIFFTTRRLHLRWLAAPPATRQKLDQPDVPKRSEEASL